MSWPWNELGLSGPAGLPEIRRAYAQRLKTTHPEEDPEGFQRLHAAYQEASRQARQRARANQAEREGGKPPAGREDGLPGPAEAEAPPSQEQASPMETDWDYDALLAGREAPKHPPEKSETADPAWNYDALLEEETPPAEEEEATPEWDYERLFAEGEAEAQEVRRRKLEELREKNRARWARQERDQRRRAEEEEESWAAVMAAAHALELLYSSGAPLFQWLRFLESPVFLNVRANLDFVFALEDFLEQHPDLSPKIHRALFSAYEACNASKYPMYNRLYKLLNVDRRDMRQASRDKCAWRVAWRSYPPWRKAVIALCFTFLAGFALLVIGLSIQDSLQKAAEKREAEQWEVNILRWLEEDYGEPFTLAVRDNIYTPEADSTLYFWVIQDGERTSDWPGYRTDYPHIRIMRAMEDFAGEWGLGLDLDGAGGFSGGIGNAPGAYLFDLPLLGAEEAISALGELLSELKAQDWYRTPEDQYGGKIEYQIFLCHSGLSFYDAISTQDGGFDPAEALARYQSAGSAFCRYILENSGLAAEHMGEGAYILLDQEAVEIDGNTLFQVSGVDEASGEVRVQYFFGGGMLFCVPSEKMDQIHSIVDLYRGSISHLQLDKVGLVIVTDQVPAQ